MASRDPAQADESVCFANNAQLLMVIDEKTPRFLSFHFTCLVRTEPEPEPEPDRNVSFSF